MTDQLTTRTLLEAGRAVVWGPGDIEGAHR
jgi:hypothetical protein